MDDAAVQAAPAKINLYLHVTGRGADGYHLLDSLIAFAEVHDTVAATPSETLDLSIAGPQSGALAGEPDNLVLRAARALADLAGREPAARLRLVKRLPVASGIGGGSADAAAALRALMDLWRIAPAEDALAALALDLGADVPICLAGHAAFVGGVGEEIAPAPAIPETPIVLVNPGVAVSTPDVFKARQGAFTPSNRFADSPATVAQFAEILRKRGNDLFEPALSVAPVIGDVIAALENTGECCLARMSGSGATCFGLYPDFAAAGAAAAALGRAHPNWWVVASRLVTDSRTVLPLLD